MTIGEREGNGPWRESHRGHHKSSLRTYEVILADIKARIAHGE
jgi:hypothetical protein